ncbi:TadA family conjugal transfer-associated ATPase [Ruicaihuangia caeni]|uniref:TadA family conjugal transfer-associated ATPase n=1 Tax=Ruicaihuangia caeni TaxID=3042517 RepID=A0AAW6TA37_9MICO|nr:TadA family conjugal transfer-associated ATPase [Klugiella sp. YN-L-19]MDI2099259.1 TadA family conjugal transfer-associated ATPase [Klugiella sp. YN-L-19]
MPLHAPVPGDEVFGALASLLRDERITDIVANGAGPVLVDRGDGFHSAGVHLEEPELRALAVALIAAGGRHVDEANPCIDVRLGAGIRVHAVLPVVSPSGTLLSIRVPGGRPPDLATLEGSGCFEKVPREHVQALVDRRANVLITGAGGAGKTTLLAAMLSAAAQTERIIAVEDVAELRVQHPHFVPLEARQANLEGAGAIGLSRLVREALRMRPDRLVLGECRGAEVRELLAALNTGHDGGAGTLHANSLEDVPARLEALGALAGMSDRAIARQTVSAIDAVIHVERRGGARKIAKLGCFAIDGEGRLTIAELRDHPGVP